MRGGVPAVSFEWRRESGAVTSISVLGTSDKASACIAEKTRSTMLQITLPAGYLGSSLIGAALIACVSLGSSTMQNLF